MLRFADSRTLESCNTQKCRSSNGQTTGRRWVSASFFRSYLRRPSRAGFYQPTIASLKHCSGPILLEKTLYELRYELNNRPEWVSIPLEGLSQYCGYHVGDIPHMSTAFAPPVDRRGKQFSLITADDLHLFNEGTHYDLWRKLGAHVVEHGDTLGTYFAVWAPNAKSVS